MSSPQTPPRRFTKPALDVTQQITLLRQRGLSVPNEQTANRYLKSVGYYRLSGYMLPFQTGGRGTDRHVFLSGTSFEDLINLYEFDRELRLIFLDALERIEVGIRAAVTSAMAVTHGAHWYMYPHHLVPGFNHSEFLERTESELGKDGKRRDIFIDHYFNAYDEPDMPPSWMAFEALPFGTVSHLISKLTVPNRNKIASHLNLPEPILKSWCHSLSYLRNLCAHHCRIWNRTFTITPYVSNQYKADLTPNNRAYAQAVTLQVMIKRLYPASRWGDQLKRLFTDHPEMDAVRLGFPNDWLTRSLWR
jgi:abortive infection bacteriophage resistance protein